ncbi:MlaD family protein [Iamia majanohamensis]|uniref:MlaD family protein n=1 Tax=Iamia majanohamensis TaxID=467976 RepID=A0AAE9Y9P4_9ACTN|nr:MlaD family protein [Iamia majanohamensis]WCO65012.1 MlaD family protein [Iamia majanohamensis]
MRLVTRLLVVVLAVVVAGTGCGVVGGGADGYEVTARFDRGIAVYPGSPVRVIGIDVGTVTDVVPEGGRVTITMEIGEDHQIPADATATIVPLSLLGERYVQIGPAYEEGPTLGPGDEIGRTRVPAEFDELLRGLQDLTGAIDPDAASELVTDLATLLDGQGAQINDLLEDGAGTAELVADKADEIGDIITSLAELSRTLKDRTGSVQELLRSYNLLAEILTENRDDLDATITQLDRAVVALTGVLERHDEQLPADVEVLAGAGSTLGANVDRLQSTLADTVRLFTAAGRVYDPERRVLPFTTATDPTTTTDLITSRLRDRLAGICRRLGLPVCSSPTASFFDDLLEALPDLLDPDARGGQGAEAPAPETAPPPTTAAPTPSVPVPPVPDVPDLPPPPDVELLLGQVLERIGDLLDDAQRQVLEGLDAGLLEAIPRLTDAQLAGLTRLTPAQLAGLAAVDPTRLGPAVDALLREDPEAQMDPLLPGAGGTVDDLLDDVLGALGSGGGR